MVFELCVSEVLEKFRKLSVTVAATMVLCGLMATGVLAGDISSGTDSLSVTGATTGVLPQAAAGGVESGILSGLHVSGYGQQTFGMWQDPPALRDYTPQSQQSLDLTNLAADRREFRTQRRE